LLDKTKPAASFRWQRVIGESFFARFGLLAQEHDHQPATVVGMPMSIVAVTCSKHRFGFIPDQQVTCQI
jgi:precorrin isomerase